MWDRAVKVLDSQFGKERKYKKLKCGYANGKFVFSLTS